MDTCADPRTGKRSWKAQTRNPKRCHGHPTTYGHGKARKREHDQIERLIDRSLTIRFATSVEAR
jgi:hypothetical protein